jgi:hypothetical protein
MDANIYCHLLLDSIFKIEAAKYFCGYEIVDIIRASPFKGLKKCNEDFIHILSADTKY